ncbi:hypothetical protein [Sphingomonas sp.]|uniref:hypothetical protein n=1 Tax=Sphingomonas sp. TaxID=28214 RepID=UPI001B01253B|nr:hypothetical protein [Sphingomonas sp.]MBO9711863.1 hypothetical protein [Sphingomonas sp.]
MKRDWWWFWGALIPAAILAIGLAAAFQSLELGETATMWAFMLTFAVVPFAVLCLRNRASVRKIRNAGGNIEMLIRPWDALKRAAVMFPMMIGLHLLFWLVFPIAPSDWGRVVVQSAVMSFAIAIGLTEYRRTA